MVRTRLEAVTTISLVSLSIILLTLGPALCTSPAPQKKVSRLFTDPRHARASLIQPQLIDTAAAAAAGSAAAAGPATLSSSETPDRQPLVFKNRLDLMNYLKKLNEYYAIVGRPRFGKRASWSWSNGDDVNDSSASAPNYSQDSTEDQSNDGQWTSRLVGLRRRFF